MKKKKKKTKTGTKEIPGTRKKKRAISRNFKQNEVIGSCCFAVSFSFSVSLVSKQESSTQETDQLILHLCLCVCQLCGSTSGEQPRALEKDTCPVSGTHRTFLLPDILTLAPTGSRFHAIEEAYQTDRITQGHASTQPALPYTHPSSPGPRPMECLPCCSWKSPASREVEKWLWVRMTLVHVLPAVS